MLSARTTSAAATKQLAEALAGLVRPKDVILLDGEMGAGKTAFAQGFARGLGVVEPVTSPTFTLVRSHPGRIRLHHVDAYRLERSEELVDLGLPELVDGDGVTLIEWGELVAPVLSPEYLAVQITFGDAEDERSFVLRPLGSAWTARQRALGEVVAPWADGAAAAC